MSRTCKQAGLWLLGLFLWLTAVEACAADWWFVPQEKVTEDLLYIDKSSLERPGHGSRAQGWVWAVFKSDRASEKGAYRSEKRHLLVDCEKNLAGVDAVTRYAAFGGPILQSRSPNPGLSPRNSAISQTSLYQSQRDRRTSVFSFVIVGRTVL